MSLLEQDTYRAMQLIAGNVEKAVGDGYGFMVMVFPFDGDNRVANYISNARSEDMIKALREQACVLEAKLDLSANGSLQ